jgi:hypothetical protein
MKTATAIFLVLCCGMAAFALDEHEVVFTEGFPVRRDQSGGEEDLFIGDVLVKGNTVVTERGDFVEMDAGGYTVKIAENTVFTIMEVEQGGQTRPVLANVLGRVDFARTRLGGPDPRLITNSAVCGVRGTQFTLYAGADGSSLIVVDDGLVEVSAEGASVELAAGEGVEIQTGSAPGEKFAALSSEIDYSEWDSERLESLLRDPVAATQKIERRLDGYIEQIGIIYPLWQQKFSELTEARKKRDELRAKGDTEGMRTFYVENVAPLEREVTNLFINLRFYALSSLSLRRFVQGRLYVQMKSRYLAEPDALEYQAFLESHRHVLAKFQASVAVDPILVPADM